MSYSLEKLKNFTVEQMMNDGRIDGCRFSPRLIAILAKADRNEALEINQELADFDDDGDYDMPADSDFIPVTQWSESEDSNEPGEWSIFMFKDPLTKSTRMVAWMCDSHSWPYTVAIV